MMRDLAALTLLICCAVVLTLIGVAGCGSDTSKSSYCDHGNRIYPDHGVAANDPSCPR